MPQILIVVAAVLILISIIVIAAEYIALNKNPTEKKQGAAPSAVRERSRYY